jgi:hypothetical protein
MLRPERPKNRGSIAGKNKRCFSIPKRLVCLWTNPDIY